MYLVFVIAVIFAVLTAALLVALYPSVPPLLMHKLAGMLDRISPDVWRAGFVVLALLAILAGFSSLHRVFLSVAVLMALLLRPPRMLTRWIAKAPPTPVLSRLWLGILLGLFLLTSIVPFSDTGELTKIIGWDAAISINPSYLSLVVSNNPHHLSPLISTVGEEMAYTITSNPYDSVLIAGIAVWGIILTLLCLPRWRAVLPSLVALTLIIVHFEGYKIYGSVVYVDNRASLPEGLRIDRIELPGTLIATDGSRHTLRHFAFPDWLEKRTPQEQRQILADRGFFLQFVPHAASRSGHVAIMRFYTNCGTGLTPGPFPPRIRLYHLEDLTSVLERIHFSYYHQQLRLSGLPGQ